MNSSSSSSLLKLVCGLSVLVVATGCASTSALLTSDPSGTPLFEQGQDALVAREWRDAINAFDTLLRNYPSSPYLAEARLGLGRAHYELARVENLIMAIDAFQGFLTYHPTHEFVDYAQYMIGMTYAKQMLTPDRDQAPTRSAIAAFEFFLDSYTDSPLRAAVVQERKNAIDSLASHELQVARWQATREFDWDAAIDRVKFALEAYPDTTLKCDLFFTMALAYEEGEQFEDAIRYYEQVTNDYPDCELVEDAQKRIREINGV
jgi:outer membrane protein assembly factor BamD